MSQLKELKTIQDAKRMADEVEHLEAVIKELKSRLKTFVDSNGAFETTEKVWDYSESVSWKFESRALKEVATLMAMEGINPWEMLTLPANSVKKLGWGEEALQQFGEKKVIKRFTSHKREKVMNRL